MVEHYFSDPMTEPRGNRLRSNVSKRPSITARLNVDNILRVELLAVRAALGVDR